MMLNYHPTAGGLAGENYQAFAPDTLDLADRMSLAIHALTNVWYPDQRWGQGFLVDFSQIPAVLYPSHPTDAYLNIPPKFLEALTLCRLASGNDQNLPVDTAVLETQLSLLGEDGLAYCPDGTFLDFTGERNFAEIWGEGRMLSALTILSQVDPNPVWQAMGRRKIDRLLALSQKKEDYRFYWQGRFKPGATVPAGADEPWEPNLKGSLADYEPLFSKVYSIGALGHGAGVFYRLTGYQPALELAGGLARWGMKRVFNQSDGRYNFWHFHHGLYALMAVCEYALAAQDGEILSRVDACFRWAMSMGDPLIGFFTELIPEQQYWQYLNWNGKTVEICEVADMLWLALNLTRSGVADYWDEIDRWTRNVFAEGQITDLTKFDRIPASYYNLQPAVMPHQDDHEIINRSKGAFLGWMRANDGLKTIRTDQGMKLANLGIQHCCTANGARALYHIWDSILTHNNGIVQINLLLNRASPFLDLDSYLPDAGRVVLKIKAAPRVHLRYPSWCRPDELQVMVSGEIRTVHTAGRYLLMDNLRPGDIVDISFPMAEQTFTRVLGDLPYILKLRGSNVVDIDPPGTAYPLYQHPAEGKLVSKNRHIPTINSLIW